MLKGETALSLRRHIARAKGKATKTGASGGASGRKNTSTVVSPGDAPFFDALRQWRADKAREQGVPAYVILHDRTLLELAAHRPETAEALLEIPGIGQAKAERYGEELLDVLTEAAQR